VKLKGPLDSFRLPIEIARFFFPELDSTRIKIKEIKIKGSFNATTRPAFFSLFFNGKSNRKYIIRVNSTAINNKIRIDRMPFNALIGLFGHEISHILDYSVMSNCQIVWLGFSYLSRGYKEKYEKNIDQITIIKGLGWQLYDLEKYVLDNVHYSEEYKKYMKDIYLEPSEIEHLIKTDPYYIVQ
jgi:hypothetical protein